MLILLNKILLVTKYTIICLENNFSNSTWVFLKYFPKFLGI